jgi:hypothetical protein
VQSSVQGGDVGVARVSPLLVQVTIANVRD